MNRLACASALALSLSVLLAGCGNDDPTGVGAPLYPEGVVRTFEIVLDAPQFLLADTMIGGFIDPGQSGLLVVAEDFGGSLDAHSLLRFSLLPKTVQFTGSTGSQRTDTLPSFIGADLVLYPDSASVGAGPVTVALNLAAEPWDAGSADWTNRVDTTGVEEPWTQPGGTMADRIGTAEWVPGTDSVLVPIDSQTVALFADSDVVQHGLILSSTTPGTRIESSNAVVRLHVRPSLQTDTVVTFDQPLVRSTFVYDPPAASSPGLRIGGIPTWQSALELRSEMDTLVFACPDEPSCRIPLDKATISTAELLLQPLPTPPGFRPGDSLHVETRPVIRSPLLPLARSPLGDAVSVLRPGVAPSSFLGVSGSAERFAVPITAFVRSVVQDTARSAQPTLMLLPYSAGPGFGFGEFGSVSMGAFAPQLRLVLTISEQVLLR